MATNRKTMKGKKKKPGMAETWMEGYLRETGRAVGRTIAGEEAVSLAKAVMGVSQPLLDKAEGLPERRRIVALAIVAWNLCALPEGEREDCFDRVMGDFAGMAQEDSDAGRDIVYKLSFLVGRRGTLYPSDRRFIAGYSLEFDRGEAKLQVVGGELNDE